MKKRFKIAGVVILLLIVITILIPGKNTAGYSYFPFMNERLEIIPPHFMENELKRIVIEDKKEIKRFINSIEKSKTDPIGDGYRAIVHYRNNDKPYIAIKLSADFPERIIGWEYLKEGNEAYLVPTLYNKNGESYTPSPELIKWMDEQIETHWPELENH